MGIRRCGANADVDPADLLDFAAYGCAYYKSLEGHDAESVALLNVGKERHKGSKLIQEAAQLWLTCLNLLVL